MPLGKSKLLSPARDEEAVKVTKAALKKTFRPSDSNCHSFSFIKEKGERDFELPGRELEKKGKKEIK